jgi:hypothetical protein
VQRIHWTLESSRDYGRRIAWVAPSPKRLLRSIQVKVWGKGGRRCTPGVFLTLHPWKITRSWISVYESFTRQILDEIRRSLFTVVYAP